MQFGKNVPTFQMTCHLYPQGIWPTFYPKDGTFLPKQKTPHSMAVMLMLVHICINHRFQYKWRFCVTSASALPRTKCSPDDNVHCNGKQCQGTACSKSKPTVKKFWSPRSTFLKKSIESCCEPLQSECLNSEACVF